MHHGNKPCNVPLKVDVIKKYILHSLFVLYSGKKALKSIENFYWRKAFFTQSKWNDISVADS